LAQIGITIASSLEEFSHSFLDVVGGGEHSLGDVDLAFATTQADVDTVADGLAVSCWVEDVAYSLTLGEGVVGDLLGLVVVRVREGDQEFASGESVEVLSCVAFHPRLIPDGGLLALSVYLCDNLVEITSSAHTLPQRFTVGGVIAA